MQPEAGTLITRFAEAACCAEALSALARKMIAVRSGASDLKKHLILQKLHGLPKGRQPNVAAATFCVRNRRMTYAASGKDVPSYVPAFGRRQWSAVWNSEYRQQKGKGKSDKEAEQIALASALSLFFSSLCPPPPPKYYARRFETSTLQLTLDRI